MYSNKTVENVNKRSSAIPGMYDITKVYDTETNTVNRTSKHSTKAPDKDEMSMMDDLRELKPFQIIPGRQHMHFCTTPKSLLNNFDGANFANWFTNHKSKFTP